jgi:hypothetical protein
VQLLYERKEELLPNTSVSEAHAYPLRPPSFEEPFFSTAESRRTVVEHLRKAQWLSRASELRSHTGETDHAPEEPIEPGRRCGCIELIRGQGKRRCSWRRRRVVKVLDRWRVVCNLWDEERNRDRFICRLLLSGSAVVDLARAGPGRWLLVGVLD